MSGGCGACGCAGEQGEAKTESRLAGFCPKCTSQAHSVNVDVLENVLKRGIAQTYTGATPNLCLNPTCEVCYFDLNTNEVFYNDDCKIGIWFKDNSKDSYICYCEQVTEKEIIETVVESGLDDLGSVMLYLCENIGEDCEKKQPAAISCNRYFQDAIEKAQIIREALTNYRELKPNSKEIPYQLIEDRYNRYLLARGDSMAEVGGSCGGGSCSSCG